MAEKSGKKAGILGSIIAAFAAFGVFGKACGHEAAQLAKNESKIARLWSEESKVAPKIRSLTPEVKPTIPGVSQADEAGKFGPLSTNPPRPSLKSSNNPASGERLTAPASPPTGVNVWPGTPAFSIRVSNLAKSASTLDERLARLAQRVPVWQYHAISERQKKQKERLATLQSTPGDVRLLREAETEQQAIEKEIAALEATHG